MSSRLLSSLVAGAARPVFRHRLTEQQLPQFFDSHRQELSPEAIYRAKVWGRLDREYQLDFVDAGLIPVVEEEAGQRLTDLIEPRSGKRRNSFGWDEISASDGQWLLKAVFWLLAGKILHDKAVPGFIRLNLTDVDKVYEVAGAALQQRISSTAACRRQEKREAWRQPRAGSKSSGIAVA